MVKVREEIEEGDAFDYGTSSLQSLKAFEWLSFDHFSSSGECLVRIPASNILKSPTPGFRDETNKITSEKGKNVVRSTSTPRPRAVLSSPDNDDPIWSKTRTRKGLLSALKSHNSCQNRHTKCGNHKEPTESKNHGKNNFSCRFK